MTKKRRRRLLGLPWTMGAIVALAGCAGESDGSAEGCEAPRVIAEQNEVSPGERLEISGTGFFDGCVDFSGNGTPQGTMSPYDSIDIVGTQAEDVIVEQFGVPVSSDGTFETAILLPDNLGADPIVITAPRVAGTEPLVLTPLNR